MIHTKAQLPVREANEKASHEPNLRNRIRAGAPGGRARTRPAVEIHRPAPSGSVASRHAWAPSRADALGALERKPRGLARHGPCCRAGAPVANRRPEALKK